MVPNVYLKTIDLPSWLSDEYFYGRDIVSIDDLIATLEELDSEYKILEEKYEDFKREVEDNYKFIDTKEAIGYDEKW